MEKQLPVNPHVRRNLMCCAKVPQENSMLRKVRKETLSEERQLQTNFRLKDNYDALVL